jgi:hypothetical protein
MGSIWEATGAISQHPWSALQTKPAEITPRGLDRLGGRAGAARGARNALRGYFGSRHRLPRASGVGRGFSATAKRKPRPKAGLKPDRTPGYAAPSGGSNSGNEHAGVILRPGTTASSRIRLRCHSSDCRSASVILSISPMMPAARSANITTRCIAARSCFARDERGALADPGRPRGVMASTPHRPAGVS